MNKVKICLVDDHKLFRSGIKEMLLNLKQFEVIFEADNGYDFFERLGNKWMPDLVILDINMPKLNGIEVAEQLKLAYPKIKIIILSMEANADIVNKMIKIGIDGFILKHANKEEFVAALETVKAGNTYFCATINNVLLTNIKSKADNTQLSNKDISFLKLLCQQLSYQDIAAKMGVSVRTVEGYRDQLFEKLNIRNKMGLVIYAIKNKLVNI